MRPLRTLGLLAFAISFVVTTTTAGGAAAFPSNTSKSLPFRTHSDMPVHEGITADALVRSDADVGPNFLVNLQSGVANLDSVHGFDAPAHFHNASANLDVGLAAPLKYIADRVAAAKRQLENPEFIDPSFTSFRGIFDAAVAAGDEVSRSACNGEVQQLCAPGLSRVTILRVDGVYLEVNPNPDPHMGSPPRSPFGRQPRCVDELRDLCALSSQLQARMSASVASVDNFAAEMLDLIERAGYESSRRLPQGVRDQVPRLETIQDQVAAYRAFQELGHGLHTAQDFFAHSNYVELMTGVTEGDAIWTVDRGHGLGPWRPRDVPVPSWSDFTPLGLENLMLGEYRRLESGSLTMRWLGEADACRSPDSIFNPSFNWTFDKADLGPYTIPAYTIPAGAEASPADGFTFCHFETITSPVGLNKDSPCKGNATNVTDPTKCDEPSHVNFPFARKAAVKMTEQILTDLLIRPGGVPHHPPW